MILLSVPNCCVLCLTSVVIVRNCLMILFFSVASKKTKNITPPNGITNATIRTHLAIVILNIT